MFHLLNVSLVLIYIYCCMSSIRNCLDGDRVAILAFHLALVERPWSLTVGPTVALALSFGTGLEKAITQVQKLCDAVDKNGKHLWNDQFR